MQIFFITKRIMAWFLFVIYLVLLTKLILFKYLPISEVIHSIAGVNPDQFIRNVQTGNFVPFLSIYLYLFVVDNPKISFANIFGNIVIFLPLGFLLPIISGKYHKFISAFAIFFFTSSMFEVAQLVSGVGSFDIDDIILNTFGGSLGWLTLKIVDNLLKKPHTLRVYYDGWCPMCSSIKLRSEKLDWFKLIEFVSFRELSEDDISIPLSDMEKRMHALNIKTGEIVSGINAITAMSARIPLFMPFWPLCKISGVFRFGEQLYDFIAARRKIVPVGNCNDEICDLHRKR